MEDYFDGSPRSSSRPSTSNPPYQRHVSSNSTFSTASAASSDLRHTSPPFPDSPSLPLSPAPASPERAARPGRTTSAVYLGLGKDGAVDALSRNSTMRSASGLMARVGIGSPVLDFRSGGSRRAGSEEPAGHAEEAPRDPSRRSSLIIESTSRRSSMMQEGASRRSSLTASSASPAKAASDTSHASRPRASVESYDSASPAADASGSPLARHRPPPRLSASSSPPAMSRSSSIASATSLTSSRKLRPKTGTAELTRSSSSSSSLYRTLKAAPRAGAPRSPLPHPASRSPSLASSPEKAEMSTRRKSNWEEVGAGEPDTISEASAEIERNGHGDELDQRIREAEEKIRRSAQSRASMESESSRSHFRQRDTYRRAPVTSPLADSHTLRRSATLSGATGSGGRNEYNINSPEAAEYGTERQESAGSSGSGKRRPLPSEFRQGLFTPSPKTTHTDSAPSSRLRQVAESPTDMRSPSRFADSPRSTASPRLQGTGVDRSPSLAMRNRDSALYTRRQWSESISGLPTRSELDRFAPRPDRNERRADTAMDGLDRSRYRSNASTLSSRTPLTPGDSVSAIGLPSHADRQEKEKDPMDVIRRMEQSREQSARQWEEDRAASVLGDIDRSSTRRFDRPTSRALAARPATSMSGLRDLYDRDREAPRTAPLNRLHERAFADAQLESPLARKGARTLADGYGQAGVPAPRSEPRQMRSSTSLGGRSSLSQSAGSGVGGAEHGRLLLEAARALENKLPVQVLQAVPQIMDAVSGSARGAEQTNALINEALTLVQRVNVRLELDHGPGSRASAGGGARKEMDALSGALRDARRSSDQSVRDLTRVLLDLPKLMREYARAGPIDAGARSGTPQGMMSGSVRAAREPITRSSLDSPARSTLSRVASAASAAMYDRGARRSVDGGGAAASSHSTTASASGSTRPSTSLGMFVSRLRSPRKSSLPPIKDDQDLVESPPRHARSALDLTAMEGEKEERFSSHGDGRVERSSSHVLGREDTSPSRSTRAWDRNAYTSPEHSSVRDREWEREPAAPQSTEKPKERERDRPWNILRKKPSAASTHTLRAGAYTSPLASGISAASGVGTTTSPSAFFPSSAGGTATTAISNITAGDVSPSSATASFATAESRARSRSVSVSSYVDANTEAEARGLSSTLDRSAFDMAHADPGATPTKAFFSPSHPQTRSGKSVRSVRSTVGLGGASGVRGSFEDVEPSSPMSMYGMAAQQARSRGAVAAAGGHGPGVGVKRTGDGRRSGAGHTAAKVHTDAADAEGAREHERDMEGDEDEDEDEVDEAVLALAAAAAERERGSEREEAEGGDKKEGGLSRLRSWRRRD